MLRLVFTHAARANLVEIADYIENASGSSAAAERFADALITRCEHLAELSGTLGRPRPELLPNLRSTPHGSYVIFFATSMTRLKSSIFWRGTATLPPISRLTTSEAVALNPH